MSQATSEHHVFTTLPAPASTPAARLKRVRGAPAERLRIPASAEDRHWLEDAASALTLCVVFGVAMAGSVWMIREFFEGLIDISSFDIIRAMAGR